MKYISFIIILSFLSCKPQIKSNKLKENTLTDTLLLRTNPKTLDLTKNQLFIDTTKNSNFYKQIKDWSRRISGDTIKKTVKTSTLYIRVRKLNDQFVIYYKCDGITPRIKINEAYFTLYESFETFSLPIERSLKNDDGFNIVLNNATTVSIKKTKTQKVYKLNYKSNINNFSYYVTKLDSINQFDMVVNHCVNSKVIEYSRFLD